MTAQHPATQVELSPLAQQCLHLVEGGLTHWTTIKPVAQEWADLQTVSLLHIWDALEELEEVGLIQFMERHGALGDLYRTNLPAPIDQESRT